MYTMYISYHTMCFWLMENQYLIVKTLFQEICSINDIIKSLMFKSKDIQVYIKKFVLQIFVLRKKFKSIDEFFLFLMV